MTDKSSTVELFIAAYDSEDGARQVPLPERLGGLRCAEDTLELLRSDQDSHGLPLFNPRQQFARARQI